MWPIARISRCTMVVAAWIVATSAAAFASDVRATEPAAVASSVSPADLAEYRKRLEEYNRARQQFDADAAVYWNSISEKRQIRNEKRRKKQEIAITDYILIQPPLYSGPPRPVDPTAPEVVPPVRYVPVVADFLKAAAQHFQFVPQRPESEIEFKRAYARIASAAGLTREQAVRIYGFEAGGNGKYDVQAGLEYARPGARAISTALGYNQLLSANSVELLAEQGDRFVRELKRRADESAGERRQSLNAKIAILQRMIAFARAVPNSWSEHVKLARTPQGLGVHALNLDIDVGPLLQTQKLLDSLNFTRAKGHKKPLTAAELEMMNLTGDGNGFDMVTMPAALRSQVPTSNFFQQGGYERNPVAIRNNVVAKLMAATDAKMDKESLLDGAKDLARAF